jgi:hypothetical protein
MGQSYSPEQYSDCHIIAGYFAKISIVYSSFLHKYKRAFFARNACDKCVPQ